MTYITFMYIAWLSNPQKNVCISRNIKLSQQTNKTTNKHTQHGIKRAIVQIVNKWLEVFRFN